METFNWLDFLRVGILLLAFYFLLYAIKYSIERFAADNAKLGSIKKINHLLLIGYEPIALIFLSIVFIFINPYFHGVLWLICVVLGFNSIRNYMIGRLFQIDTNIEAGRRIKIGSIKGLVTKMNNQGIYIQNSEGLHFIGYAKPFKEGYSALTSDEVGGFYQLKITPKMPTNTVQHIALLEDLFVTTPYLDNNHHPKVQLIQHETTPFLQCSILLRENSYLPDFEQLVNEWGYDCTILNDLQ